MPYFAVIRERASGWDWSAPMRRQAEWDAHAAFMDDLANRRLIIAGGPLGSENEARRVLHIFDMPDIASIEALLERDPWTPMQLLKTLSIEPWNLLLGSPVRFGLPPGSIEA